ncbi:MAG: hypothetical protein AABW85_04225 [archaeon]
MVVKESDFSLDEIPQPVLLRAKLFVLNALAGAQYNPKIGSSSMLLRDEVLAFPVAKIFVSLINTVDAFAKFSRVVSKNVFARLESESTDVVFRVANEAGVKFVFDGSGQGFVFVPLAEFLSAEFSDEGFKIVNQKVAGGNVFLQKNEFVRFVSSKIEKRLFDSFPLDVTSVPKELKSIAKEISASAFESRKGKFAGMALGEVRPVFFPPCIEKLYLDILGGRNLSHLERFSLATFMISVGMPIEQVINLYAGTPNFDRKLTTYQVTRLAGKGGTKYSAASCMKMHEYKLRLPICPCVADKKVRHPVQVYQSNFGQKN